MKLGCVLLAAGAGRRFGGGKLLHEIDGEPMIARALRLYDSVSFAARICVVRAETSEIARLARESGFTLAVNPDPERGVGTSVAIGTQTALLLEPQLEGILYAVADQPYLQRDSVLRLLEAYEEDAQRIVALSYEGARGNPVVFPQALWGSLMQLTEDIGGGAVIRRYPEMLRLVEAGSPRELEDVDTQTART